MTQSYHELINQLTELEKHDNMGLLATIRELFELQQKEHDMLKKRQVRQYDDMAQLLKTVTDFSDTVIDKLNQLRKLKD